MEPIGQKVLIPSSDEIVVASDLVENSLENLETRIFDKTLDGALAELHVEEDVIDDLLTKTEDSNSLKSVNLTKITDIEMTPTEIVDSNLALEVMEEILLSDEVSLENNDNLQKKENFTADISETKEISIEDNEIIFDLSDKNDKSTNIVDDMGKNIHEDLSENQLQSFFHFTNSQKDNSGFFDGQQENIVKKYDNEKILSSKSDLELKNEKIFHSEASESESFLSMEKQSQSDEKVVNPDFFKINQENIQSISKNKSGDHLKETEIDINILEPESGSDISKKGDFKDNKEFLEEFKPVLEGKRRNIPEQLKNDSGDILKQKTNDLNKFALGENDGDSFSNIKKDELSQYFGKSKSNSEFGIDENLERKEILQVKTNNIVESDDYSSKEVKSQVRVNGEELFEEVSDVKKLESKDLGKVLVQAAENKKVFDNENSASKVSFNPSLQETDNLKIPKEQKVLVKEELSDVNDHITEKLKVPIEQKVLVKEKLNEEIKVIETIKLSKDQESLAKARGFNDLQGLQGSLSDEIPIPDETKIASNVRVKEKDITKEITEKMFIEPLTKPRNVSFQEIESYSNTKSFPESSNNIVINSNVDVSNSLGVKSLEITNSTTESLRNIDLPFNVEQVVSRVRIIRGNGVEEMTLRLNPEELGQITLKIRQSGADLSIDMRVDNSQAKQLVESGFDSLRNRFLDNEFSYQDLALNVDINEGDSQFGRDRRNSEFDENISAADKTEIQDNNEEEKVQRATSTDTGLNLYV